MRRSLTLKSILLLFVVAVLGVSTVRSAFAATGQIYVSPGTTSVQNQSNFIAKIRINPGTGVNAVQFTLNWDSTKVKYVGVDSSQTAFGTALGQSVTASSLTSYRGIGLGDSAVSSDSLILAVTFQALTGSGSSSLSLTNVNAAAPDGSYTDPSAGNGTVNFTTPASPPPSGGTSGGGSSGTSSGGTKPSTGSSTGNSGGVATPSAGDTTPPKLESVKTDDDKVKFKSASISLTTSEPTQVYVKYGLNGQLNLQTTLSEFSKTHDINLATAGLLPGNTYSYQVIAKDTAGNEVQSPVKTFKTKGYTLRVTVLGSNNLPLRNVQVVLRSDPMTAKTDDNGVAQFNDVAPGSHHVTYTNKGKDYTQAIAVDDNVVTNQSTGVQTAALQSVAVQFAVKGSKPFPVALPITVLGLLAVAVVAYLFRNKLGARMRLQPQAASVSQPTMTAPLGEQPSQGQTGLSAQAPPPIEHVSGLRTPDPGSVVTPHEDNKRIVE